MAKATAKKQAKKATATKAVKKTAPKKSVPGERTGEDLRGHEVRMFQEGGIWYVEKNNNGAIHPVACVNKKEANDLFEKECNEVD